VRQAGVVDSARGLVPCSHVGWGYADRVEFRTRAWEYLLDGVGAGQRIEFVGSGSVEALRAELAGFAGGDPNFGKDAIDRGVLRIGAVDEVYAFSGAGRLVDPDRSVTARVAATEDALAAGYAGLRAVVDATALTGTAAQRAAYAHYEYLLDQESTVRPLATICAYDIGQLGSAAVAEMACLHPLTSRGASPFRLYTDDGAAFALAGEIDFSSTGQLADTLSRVLPLMSGPELVVDGRELEFIDHRGLITLDRCAGRHDVRLALYVPRQTVAQIAEALGLQHVRVDVLR
jgi:anti-anti-sigma regulatory factor